MGPADTGSAWLCVSAPEIGFFFFCMYLICLFVLADAYSKSQLF